MLCPFCGYDNLEGMDRCENCMEPLRDLDIPRADAATGVVRSVMEDDLHELSQRDALTVAPTDGVADVVSRMKEANAACALVLDGARLAGLFTERDAVRVLIGGAAERTQIADAMTGDVMPLAVTDSVAQALNQMTLTALRFVPVKHEDGRYTIVSAANLLEYIAEKDW